VCFVASFQPLRALLCSTTQQREYSNKRIFYNTSHRLYEVNIQYIQSVFIYLNTVCTAWGMLYKNIYN
jgi:hypothetical protein